MMITISVTYIFLSLTHVPFNLNTQFYTKRKSFLKLSYTLKRTDDDNILKAFAVLLHIVYANC